jgi:uncharacterized membrane protein
MAATSKQSEKARPTRAVRIALGSVGGIVLTFLTLLAGVGLAAVLGGRGKPAEWSKWSDVGQTFGVLSSIFSGLALVALVVISQVQFRELQEHRQLMTRSHAELERAAEAGRGRLHLEILRMAIDDPQLAEVWPPFEPGLSPKQNRQYLYANVIYQFQQTWMEIGGRSELEMIDNMRYLFTSPIMRDYWKAAERARATLVPGTREYDLARKVDDLWHQYEAVAATRPRKVQDLRDRRGEGIEPTDDGPGAPEAA